MKYPKVIISIFLSICFLASCSMEKRVYRRGYHVEWNKTEDKTAIQAESKPVKIPARKIRMRTVIPSVRKQETKNIRVTKSFIASIRKQEKKDTTFYVVKKKKGTAPDSGGQANQNDKKKLNIPALISFVFSILVMLTVILIITAGSLGFLVWGILAALALSVLALVLGLFGLFKIKANPGTYLNKWMAVFGMIVPVIFVLGLILIFVV